MKLYYSPGACSLSPHIVLREAGLAFTPVLASTKTHKLADGTDYYTINPKGYVPLLELDDGQRLSEGPAIVQYIADQVPDKKLVAPWGSMERYRQIEWLTFIGTEIHKSFSPLFAPNTPEETKTEARARIQSRLEWVNQQLEGKQYLMGERLLRRRCLPVHRDQLEQVRRPGHLGAVAPGRLHGPHGGAPSRAGSA